MKKNFKPLVLLAATVFSVGLTSCIDNEVAPEVKSIYEKQAGWIGAQTEVSLAEARYKDSQSELNKQSAALIEVQVKLQAIDLEIKQATKDATTKATLQDLEAKKLAAEKMLFDTQVAFEAAKKKAEVDAFLLQFELAGKKIENSSNLFTKYASAKAEVISLTGQLNSKKVNLINANKELAIYSEATEENKVKAAEDVVEAKKEVLTEANSKYDLEKGKYDALVAKYGNPQDNAALNLKITNLEGEKAKLQDEVDVANAEKAKLEAKRDKAAKAVSNYQTAKSEYDVALENLNKLKDDKADDDSKVKRLEKSIKAAGFAGKTTDEIEAAKVVAEGKLTKVQKKYKAAKDAYDDLNTDFEKALDKYAAAKLVHDKKDEAVKAEEKKVADAQKAYDKAKADFDKDPNGKSLEGGVDNKVGVHSDDDTNKATLFELAWKGKDKGYSFDGNAIVGKDVATLEADAKYSGKIITDWNVVETAAAANDGKYAGWYFDVEGNDQQGKPYKEVLAEKEVALKTAKDDLADVKVAAEADEKNFARAEKEYNRVHTLLNEGKQELDAVEADKDAAQKEFTNINKALTASKNIDSINKSYEDYDYKLAEKQNAVKVAKAELDTAKSNVSDKSLKEYKDALADVSQKELEIKELDTKMADISTLITYNKALLNVNDKGGLKSLLDEAKEAMGNAKESVDDAKEKLADAQAKLEEAKAGKPFDVEAAKAELNNAINTIKANIAKLEEQIKAAEAEATKYKSLYEESVKTKA